MQAQSGWCRPRAQVHTACMQVSFRDVMEARARTCLLLALTWDPKLGGGALLTPPHLSMLGRKMPESPRPASRGGAPELTAQRWASTKSGMVGGADDGDGGGGSRPDSRGSAHGSRPFSPSRLSGMAMHSRGGGSAPPTRAGRLALPATDATRPQSARFPQPLRFADAGGDAGAPSLLRYASTGSVLPPQQLVDAAAAPCPAADADAAVAAMNAGSLRSGGADTDGHAAAMLLATHAPSMRTSCGLEESVGGVRSECGSVLLTSVSDSHRPGVRRAGPEALQVALPGSPCVAAPGEPPSSPGWRSGGVSPSGSASVALGRAAASPPGVSLSRDASGVLQMVVTPQDADAAATTAAGDAGGAELASPRGGATLLQRAGSRPGSPQRDGGASLLRPPSPSGRLQAGQRLVEASRPPSSGARPPSRLGSPSRAQLGEWYERSLGAGPHRSLCTHDAAADQPHASPGLVQLQPRYPIRRDEEEGGLPAVTRPWSSGARPSPAAQTGPVRLQRPATALGRGDACLPMVSGAAAPPDGHVSILTATLAACGRPDVHSSGHASPVLQQRFQQTQQLRDDPSALPEVHYAEKQQQQQQRPQLQQDASADLAELAGPVLELGWPEAAQAGAHVPDPNDMGAIEAQDRIRTQQLMVAGGIWADGEGAQQHEQQQQQQQQRGGTSASPLLHIFAHSPKAKPALLSSIMQHAPLTNGLISPWGDRSTVHTPLQPGSSPALGMEDANVVPSRGSTATR
eukprot:352421-Chlamydomonas_euryale.AAC.63